MGIDSGVQDYPFLTVEEFTEACHHLDRLYCQATLGPVRRQWRLRCCSTLNITNAFGPEYNTYIQIIRPLDGELDDGDLSSFLDSLSFEDGGDKTDAALPRGDAQMLDAEEADDVSCPIKTLLVESELSESHA